jgi:hypothetical protein
MSHNSYASVGFMLCKDRMGFGDSLDIAPVHL